MKGTTGAGQSIARQFACDVIMRTASCGVRSQLFFKMPVADE